ncbi:MAG: hypothetical protein M3R09_02520, partial [Actinomycetota bacterium]|jgi:hypothetical protein|nr:hypothetical protein [Actinomycetota bacterium]
MLARHGEGGVAQVVDRQVGTTGGHAAPATKGNLCVCGFSPVGAPHPMGSPLDTFGKPQILITSSCVF